MQDIKQLIDMHNVISFDVFDTLINRNVQSALDIFQIVEMKYRKQTGQMIDFAKLRVLTEKQARKEGLYREVNLDEIYSVLEKSIGKEQAGKLKALELDVEMDFCIKNPEVYQWYQYCVDCGKTIIIISDMYMSAIQIAKILKKNGIEKYFKIYTSCDVRQTKWETGLLYQSVLSDLNVKPGEVLHIGNDKRADFEMAERQGISAVWVPCRMRDDLYCGGKVKVGSEKFLLSCLIKFIQNHLSDCRQGRDYEIGFSVFGPLLYGYLQWIKENAKNNKIDKCFFLSRDGYVLKKGWAAMGEDMGSYFYASRRAFVVPYLQYCHSFEEMVSCYKSWAETFTVDYLLERLGLDARKYVDAMKRYGYTENSLLSREELLKNKSMHSFSQEIYSDILANSKKQEELLKKYMAQEKIIGRVGIVDIGAGCTIEFALHSLIGKWEAPIELWGLYLNIFAEEQEKRKSYLNANQNRELQNVFRFCYMLLEVFLSAPHGTVLGYQAVGDKVCPLFAQYEYVEDGESVKKINDLQQGAIDFVKRFHEELSPYFKLPANVAIVNFKNFGMLPMIEDVTSWGDLEFWADRLLPLAKPQGKNLYLWHPKRCWKDFWSSLWPAGFLIRLLHSRNINRICFWLYNFSKRV